MGNNDANHPHKHKPSVDLHPGGPTAMEHPTLNHLQNNTPANPVPNEADSSHDQPPHKAFEPYERPG